jgi:hypothetical protein
MTLPGKSLMRVALVVAVCSGCDGGSSVTTPKPTTPETPETPSTRPAWMESFGGSPLGAWPVGTAAPSTNFRVRNLRGQPVADVAIACSVSGGGRIGRSQTRTDSAGIASCGEWTLGDAPGINTLTATAATIGPVVIGIEGVRSTVGVTPGRYRLEAFNGGPVPAALDEDDTGVRLELVEAELIVTSGGFELFWTTRVPGRGTSPPVRTTGTVSAVGPRLSLIVSSSASGVGDTWGLSIAGSGLLLLAGDEKSWPLGPSHNVFRLIR